MANGNVNRFIIMQQRTDFWDQHKFRRQAALACDVGSGHVMTDYHGLVCLDGHDCDTILTSRMLDFMLYRLSICHTRRFGRDMIFRQPTRQKAYERINWSGKHTYFDDKWMQAFVFFLFCYLRFLLFKRIPYVVLICSQFSQEFPFKEQEWEYDTDEMRNNLSWLNSFWSFDSL